MNNADKIIKRCRALALAGMIGITSLGSSLPAFAAGPGDDSSRVSEISTGGPGDPGNTNSSNSTTNTGNKRRSRPKARFAHTSPCLPHVRALSAWLRKRPAKA